MYRYIGIEDLVASALIELMKKEETTRRVSLQALSKYGTVIVKLLVESGQDAILFLTKESTLSSYLTMLISFLFASITRLNILNCKKMLQ